MADFITGYHRTSVHVRATVDLGGDAAYPPPGREYPRGTKVGAFYIGGDTPHVWTVAEINAMAAGVEYLLPIFTRSNPAQANAVEDAKAAVARLTAIGAPEDCLVALDLETAVNAAYVSAFCANLGKHTVVKYGSDGYLFKNPGPDYWVAEPGASAPDPRAKGTQSAWDKNYDLTWWDADFIAATAWPTKSAPKPKPVPAPKPVPVPPKHKARPARHKADGTESLDRWLAKNGQGLKTTIDTSAAKLSDRNLRKFTDYLGDGPASVMPKGLVFWTDH